MKKLHLFKSILATAALTIAVMSLSGCTKDASGGILHLSVNPEIAIRYDGNGKVTEVSTQNRDAELILAAYDGYQGKTCDTVIAELLDVIEANGYFAEEIEAENKRVVIEIEDGSKLPHDQFLNDITAEIKNFEDSHKTGLRLNIEGEKNFGYTDYHVTDYGLTDYDVTDYGMTDYKSSSNVSSSTTSKPNSTDYGVTDYGTTNYSATDYETTDYR